MRGSAAIYGSEAAVPSFYTEDLAGAQPLRTRFQRDISELEEYFRNFARRHPRLTCCMLRFQPEVGPGLDSPLVRYLSLPVVPVQMGYDPRLQLLHADDATGAIEAAVANPVRGAVNVAPSGSISLSRALRLLRRPVAPGSGAGVRAADGAARRPARRRGAGRRRGQAAALRARRRQLEAARRDRLRAALRRGRNDRGPRARRRRRPGSGRACIRGRSPRGSGSWSGERRRRSPTAGPEAIADFLRGVRVGVEDGLDPLAAAERAAASLPVPPARGGSRPCSAGCAASTTRTSGASTRTSPRRCSRSSRSSTSPGGGCRPTGVRNVPAHGRGLIVANHAGSLFPFDATMMTMALMKEHPLPRWPRFMVLDWAFELPYLSAFMRRVGGVPASPENATGCSARKSS